MEKYLRKMLSAGIIESARRGPYVSAPFFVPKLTDEPRLIIDYAHITDSLRVPSLHLPQFSDLLRAKPLPTGMLAIRIDISHAFYAIPLHPKARFLMVFRFRDSRFQFTRLPMGLATSPSFLQHTLLEATVPVREKAHLLWAHVDDLILIDRPHLIRQRISELIHVLTLWNFSINYRKRQLTPVKVIDYLGLRIDLQSRAYMPHPTHLRYLFSWFPHVSDRSPLLVKQTFCCIAAFVLSNSLRLYPFFASSLAKLKKYLAIIYRFTASL